MMASVPTTRPKRVPPTDPESRVMPNKDGGFAPNDTLLATVDASSGLIVSADMIAATNEDKHAPAAIEDVQEQFQPMGVFRNRPSTRKGGSVRAGHSDVVIRLSHES
jgi:hypothetical protein